MKNVRWGCWWERGIKANHHNILEITPLSFTTCDQKLIYIVKFQSDDLIFRHPSSMLRAKLARREEKQSTRVLQCTLAQHVCPVDKQTCVRYPWKESVVMRQKNGNNFSSFWIKTQGGHERSKEAAEHLENLWWWHTGIPNAAFLFVPHGSTRFPCPWTDAMEDSTSLGFDMRDGRSGAALMRRVMMWSPPPPRLRLPPSPDAHVGADGRRMTSVFLWLPRLLSLAKRRKEGRGFQTGRFFLICT